MWKKNTWRVGETHSKSWGEWQVRKKVRHQPFQSHSFLKTIVTSTPPVLGKPRTTHSLSSTTIAHETTFRLQKKLSLIPQLLIFHYKPTTTLSEDAHPVQVPPPSRKLTWRSLEHHHFQKIDYISSNSIFGHLPFKSYDFFGDFQRFNHQGFWTEFHWDPLHQHYVSTLMKTLATGLGPDGRCNCHPAWWSCNPPSRSWTDENGTRMKIRHDANRPKKMGKRRLCTGKNGRNMKIASNIYKT